MSHSSPAPGPSETPAGDPPGSPAAGGTPRRAFLFGGLAGAVVGGGAGTAAGRWLIPQPVPAPPPVEVEKKLPAGTKLSYAQFGEDLLAASLFYSLGIEKPTFMDVGACYPISSNNTYLFYTRGARGLLVEPNVSLAEETRRLRPGDTLLSAGIGITDVTEADYYILSEPQQNTFDKAHAEKFVREKGYKIERVVKMPLVNINRAIAEHFHGAAPDYLSIDVEGIEFNILKSLDLKRFRPKVICIETLVANTLQHNPEITKYLAAHDYEPRGMSYPNTLYMDKALLREKK